MSLFVEFLYSTPLCTVEIEERGPPLEGVQLSREVPSRPFSPLAGFTPTPIN
jgi:hypothetical protein